MAACVNFLPSGWGRREEEGKKEERATRRASCFLTLAQKPLPRCRQELPWTCPQLRYAEGLYPLQGTLGSISPSAKWEYSWPIC